MELNKRKIKLDHLGQFYAATNNEENPGTFSVSAHLKKELQPEILQQAVNDLMQRLPFMNVKRKNGFFWHSHEVLENPPKIVSERDFPAVCQSFANENYLMRIIYGTCHFTIEVLHTVCDGRSLAMVVKSVLVRYFELLNKKMTKDGVIDCADTPQLEEMEDAYARYADFRKGQTDSVKKVYVPNYEKAATRMVKRDFNLTELKNKAKAYDLTITEYLLLRIGDEFAELRMRDGNTQSIVINVPIDCRSFFPSKTLRNFVSSKAIIMAESESFAERGQAIKEQLTQITPDYIQIKISEMERFMKLGKYLPLFLKNQLIKKIGESESVGYTTGLSNLGLIKLPKEIANEVETFSFALGAEPNMPFQFASVAVGETLTLTATVTAENGALVERVFGAV